MIKKCLELVSTDGKRTPFSIEVGDPFEDDRCWCCPVNIPGLHDLNHKGIFGEDSVQSLCLALGFVKKLLESSTEDGSKICEVNSDDEWPLDVTMKI